MAPFFAPATRLDIAAQLNLAPAAPRTWPGMTGGVANEGVTDGDADIGWQRTRSVLTLNYA